MVYWPTSHLGHLCWKKCLWIFANVASMIHRFWKPKKPTEPDIRNVRNPTFRYQNPQNNPAFYGGFLKLHVLLMRRFQHCLWTLLYSAHFYVITTNDHQKVIIWSPYDLKITIHHHTSWICVVVLYANNINKSQFVEHHHYAWIIIQIVIHEPFWSQYNPMLNEL